MSDPETVKSDISAEEQQKLKEGEPQVKNDPPVPDPQPDLFKAMDIENLTKLGPGPSITIDVVPDFRDITFQLIDHCVKIFDQIRQLALPGITPATLLAYCLQTIYAYGAIADSWHIREVASYHALNFIKNDVCAQGLMLLAWNLVPPFVDLILKGLQFTFDPCRKNVAFVYSFAAYHFDVDFGRIYPIRMFIALHNLIARAQPTTTQDEIWIEWMNTVIISNDEVNITVAQFIGAGYDDFLTENYMTRKFKDLLSPCNPQNTATRPIYTRYYCDTYQQVNLNEINPYTFLMSLHPTECPGTYRFIREQTAAFNELFTDRECLAHKFNIVSGSNIMNHYYSDYMLPTFHQIPTKVSAKSTQTTLTAFATKLNFKATPSSKQTIVKTLTIPSRAAESPYEKELYLVSTPTTPSSTRGDDIFKSFIPEIEPQILHYTPWSTGRQSIYYSLTSGIKIESYEIDSFHVPQPNNKISINDENSFILDSCVPIACVVNRTHLTGAQCLFARVRQPDVINLPRVSHSLYNRTEHRLPQYSNEIIREPQLNMLPGFTPRSGFSTYTRASNKYTFSAPVSWTAENAALLIPFPILAWSSYRWIDPDVANTVYTDRYTYFVMNFRTIYGTMPEMMITPPLHCINP